MTLHSITGGRERLDQAIEWLTRLQSDDATAADWAEYTAWLEGHPDNRKAVDQAEAMLAVIDTERDAVLAEIERGRISPPLQRRRWMMGVGAAAAASIAIGLFTLNRPPDAPPATDYATTVGERRQVALADGSRLDINSNTRLSVAFSSNARHVTIDSGEVYFDVAHDAGRPFLIDAGDRRIEVVGTAFNVLRHDGAVVVTVERGIVAVMDQGQTAGGAERLTVGERLTQREGVRGGERSSVDAAMATAWRQGRLIYSDASVADVVADLNRQFPRAIRIDRAGLADLRFSGVLQLDNQTDVLRRLENFLPVVTAEDAGGIILRRKQNDRQ